MPQEQETKKQECEGECGQSQVVRALRAASKKEIKPPKQLVQ